MEEAHALLVKNLRDARIARGLSLRELAAVVGTSKSALWAWEQGKSDPSLLNAMRWCEALEFNAIVFAT